MIALLEQPPARFTFVVGRGGAGKSTAAAALAVAWSAQRPVRLLSTDPAHSAGDVLDLAIPIGVPTPACTPGLVVELLDMEARAAAWQARAREPLAELLRAGSYLGEPDIELVTGLRLPGTGELVAALRLAELAAGGPAAVVVDTAPTQPTLRLLDAADVLASWGALLTALAAKGAAVAQALTRTARPGPAAAFRAALEADSACFRELVLGQAAFLLAGRADEPAGAETARLAAALRARGLRPTATLRLGPVRYRDPGVVPADALPPVVPVPRLAPPARGCAALGEWAARLGEREAPPHPTSPGQAARGGSAEAWLGARPERLLLFAGKGGVGKSTCAAAAGLALSRQRPVLLLGTGTPGALADVLQAPLTAVPVPVTPGLRAAQSDAAAALAGWRATLPGELEPLLGRVGIAGGAALDRAVLRAFWDATPPGLDELVALVELLDAAGTDETIVLDGAPTGHFLRLVTLPELALEWTRALMRLVLEYGLAGELDALTRRVLAFSRQLQSLRDRLADAGWTGTVIVTVAEPVVEAESGRLADRLTQAGVPITAVLTNRHPARGPAPAHSGPRVVAPVSTPPPRGLPALRQFFASWELV